jgi:DNA polymerase-3 subunit delta'|tara:strand:- start:978 stop:2117 length:1140 start_codon:yes stop_codon:yes gene_type:complete
MTEAQLILSDQIDGYPHPKLTETLYGHEYQEKEFIDCYNSNKLHHGWLITGPEGIGKATLAWRIAKYVLTQPIEKIETNSFFDELSEPNIPKLDEQSKNSIEARILAESEPRLAVIRKSFDEKRKTFRASIGVDEIRRLSAFFSLSVSDGGSRVAIIDCADYLNVNAANALLKTLEEPPKNTVFLLISHNPEGLLPTVKSRCRELRLNELSKQNLFRALKQINVVIPENDKEIYSLLGGGSVGKCIRLLKYDGADIYRRILSFLNQLPNLNGFELEKFVATFSGTKNRGRLELLIELLNLSVARASKAGVLGPNLTDQVVKDEIGIFQKLCPNPNVAKKWAELAQTQSKNLNHGLSVNLDPGSMILDTFFRIEDCAKTI